jgi:hypothetical protein
VSNGPGQRMVDGIEDDWIRLRIWYAVSKYRMLTLPLDALKMDGNVG